MIRFDKHIAWMIATLRYTPEQAGNMTIVQYRMARLEHTAA